MKTVFFYGLFMDPELLTKLELKPQHVQCVYLQNHQLIIGEKATLQPQHGARVYGNIMALSDADLDQLYAGEGVREYVPQTVTVNTMGEQPITAITYILPINKVTDSNRAYVTELIAVAEKLKLPREYINEIGSRY